jgi:hypothetical protein
MTTTVIIDGTRSLTIAKTSFLNPKTSDGGRLASKEPKKGVAVALQTGVSQIPTRFLSMVGGTFRKIGLEGNIQFTVPDKQNRGTLSSPSAVG